MRRRRRLADAEAMPDDETPRRYWGGDRVQISNVIHPSSGRRATYPSFVFVQVRLGDDNVFATAEITWREVKSLTARLSDLLKERARLQRGIERARRGRG